jgi:hypothetical protein
LRQDPVTPVPLSFISEAPGSLTVRDFRVAFEPAPLPPPTTPAGGLCRPTPADQAPGDDCEADASCTCRAPGRGAPAAPLRLAAARPASHVGFTDRAAFALDRSVATRRVGRGDRRLDVPPGGFIERVGLTTDVAEVGEARAKALAFLGLTSPRLLATADPATLTARLGFTPRLAERIVENARDLIAGGGDRRKRG